MSQSSKELAPVGVSISVSVVTYFPDADLLEGTVLSLCNALAFSMKEGLLRQAKIIFVNNGGADCPDSFRISASDGIELECVRAGRNLGFGAGHNLALMRIASDYHLVLNPDVEMDEDALLRAVRWMELHPEVVALAPAVDDFEGRPAYLCRRMPSIRILFLRAFAPKWLQKRFEIEMADYELRNEQDRETVLWDPQLISGCFMLFRTATLKRIGGFDPSYFLYFEDYDLSLRAGKVGRIACVPEVKIRHAGGGASRKGMRHIWLFCRSALRFFHLHGWRI